MEGVELHSSLRLKPRTSGERGDWGDVHVELSVDDKFVGDVWQSVAYDCGVFAAASAMEIASGGRKHAVACKRNMRSHLIECLSSQTGTTPHLDRQRWPSL